MEILMIIQINQTSVIVDIRWIQRICGIAVIIIDGNTHRVMRYRRRFHLLRRFVSAGMLLSVRSRLLELHHRWRYWSETLRRSDDRWWHAEIRTELRLADGYAVTCACVVTIVIACPVAICGAVTDVFHDSAAWCELDVLVSFVKMGFSRCQRSILKLSNRMKTTFSTVLRSHES